MPTYYKPSQRRGKRLVYLSTDPEEPKSETKKAIRFLLLGILAMATCWLYWTFVK